MLAPQSVDQPVPRKRARRGATAAAPAALAAWDRPAPAAGHHLRPQAARVPETRSPLPLRANATTARTGEPPAECVDRSAPLPRLRRGWRRTAESRRLLQDSRRQRARVPTSGVTLRRPSHSGRTAVCDAGSQAIWLTGNLYPQAQRQRGNPVLRRAFAGEHLSACALDDNQPPRLARADCCTVLADGESVCLDPDAASSSLSLRRRSSGRGAVASDVEQRHGTTRHADQPSPACLPQGHLGAGADGLGMRRTQSACAPQDWQARSLSILAHRVQGGGDVFDEDHQVSRFGRRCLEAVSEVEPRGVLVDGVDEHCPHADRLCRS